VRELLAAGRRQVSEVLVCEDLRDTGVVGEITRLAVRRRVPLRRLGRERLDAVARTEAHQGVVARAAPLEPVGLDELCRTADGPPFLVVVEGVTDPQNLGAILRTAICAGATGAVLAAHRAVHVTPAVTKAAAGAVEHLPIALAPGIPAALSELARRGVWTVGLDPSAPTSVFSLGLSDQPIALVLGAEGAGLAPLTRRRCDVLAAIPHVGPVASLNVAAAAAVACFEVLRARTVTG
jgi:23S rRNA (guanosine2251-2'-O)-methyltransferase